MKTPFPAIALVVLTALASAQEREARRQEDPDGTLRVEAEVVVVDGLDVLDGKYASFFPDGSREHVGRNRQGLKHGTWKSWYPNGGRKREEGKYAGGLRDGKWKAWLPDGEKDAARTGEYTSPTASYPGGAVLARGEAFEGLPGGQWTLWWENGEVMARGELQGELQQGAWVFHHADGSFDPQWISGWYEDGLRVRDLEQGELPAARADGPGELPVLAFDPRVSDELREVGRRSLTRAREGQDDDAKAAAKALRTLGRSADALLLAELLAFDPASSEDAPAALLFEQRFLANLAAGRGTFGWQDPQTPEAAEANRDTQRRWHSLLALARLDPSFLDLDVPAALGDEFDQRGVLATLHPPVRLPAVVADDVVFATSSYQVARLVAKRRDAKARGSESTAQTIEEALAWLVAHQDLDGSWDGDEFGDASLVRSACGCDGAGMEVYDVGITGLALLALIADGNTPSSGVHREAVSRGVAWLVAQEQPRLGLIGKRQAHGFFYDHAIATQVLCEVLIAGGSDAVRAPAQRAVDRILRSRNPYGAWRYDLVPEGENDTSMTAWMISALVTAEEAGLIVEEGAIDGGLQWFDEVTEISTGRCGYDSVGSMSARVTGVNDHYPMERTEAMTGAALFARIRAGQNPESNPMLSKHADLILRSLPQWNEEGLGCDFYYWYYGAHGMAYMGGRYWKAWNASMLRALLDSQRKDGHQLGSWDPVGPWGYAGGRVYATAMAALCLEAYYRYPWPTEQR